MNKIILIIVLFVGFYGLRLNYPPTPYFDEVFYVPSAKAISTMSAYLQRRHPPLSELFMALSIKTFGYQAWAWRLPSLIFAGAATALWGYFAFILTGNIRLFWLVSFLLSLDGLWITQARIGLFNSCMMFFIISSLLLWWHDYSTQKRNYFLLFLSAICAGFAGACKWQGALVFFIPPLYTWWASIAQKDKSPYISNHFWFFYFVILLTAYFSTFLFVPFIKGMHWIDIFKLQGEIPPYHIGLTIPDRYASQWYTWPFLIRPIWYGFQIHNPDAPLDGQVIDGILCIGNPVIFLFISPVIIWLLINAYKKFAPLTSIALIGFFIFWVPSSIMRQFGLFYHFYPAFPFAILGIALLLEKMWQSASIYWQLLFIFIIVAIVISYLYFFPLWTGLSIPYTFYHEHLWLSSWL